MASHMAAGVAGGGVVILAGYAYYRSSGLQTAVQTSKEVKAYLQSTKDSVVDKTREAAKNPGQTLEALKGIVKSYVAFIPGSTVYVDSTFEQLEEIRESHGDEANKILQEITDDMSKAVSGGKADMTTASKVFESMRKGLLKLQELGKKVGGDALEKNPKAKEMYDGGITQLKGLVGKGGQGSGKVYDAINERLQTIENSYKLIQENFGQSEGSDISGQLQSGAAETLKKALGSLPMGSQILEKAPHLQDILELADKRGEQAKGLLEETYRDVVKVLEEKGKKAKELGEKAADDAKQSKGSKK